VNLVQAKAARELGVFVLVGDIVAAVPIRWVTRLLLPTAAKRLRGGRPGEPALVDADGIRHAAWDLGALLGSSASSDASRSWILLELSHLGAALPIALETGPCLAVEELPPVAQLPARSLSARRGGIAGAFRPTANMALRGATTFGLVLDPTRWFTPRELEASAAALRDGGAP
jgi:hypothetical protein